MSDLYKDDVYVIRRKIFAFLGKKFHVYDSSGNVVFFSHMKAFKLKEDIRLYTGPDMEDELLTIKARNIIDFSAAYDVYDPKEGNKIGVFKRRGFKSLIQDEWIVMDPEDREIGKIQEDSTFLALVRRFLTNLVPQSFVMELEGHPVCEYRQHFNPFVFKMTIDFTSDKREMLDKRLGLAGAVLLSAIEGRQE